MTGQLRLQPRSEDGVVASTAEPDPVLQRERIPQRDEVLANLPQVVLRQDLVPPDLALGRFVAEVTRRVINSTPVNFHNEARERIASHRGEYARQDSHEVFAVNSSQL